MTAFLPAGSMARACLSVRVEAEELQGCLRLGLLLAEQVDAARGQERTRLAGDLHRLVDPAACRELEDAAFRVQPRLNRVLAIGARGRALQLQHENGSQHAELVEVGAGRRVGVEEAALLLREDAAQRSRAGGHL